MSRLQSIATKVDEFSTVALELSTLLKGWDPAHAQLITGVLGAVQKIAKTYEQYDTDGHNKSNFAPANLGTPDSGASPG
jgi:hypothetical protein